MNIYNSNTWADNRETVRVAHVVGKLNAAGVEAVVNNYYRHIDHRKYQFDYFIDEDSNMLPPQELIDMGARYYIIPPYQKLPQYIKELERVFRENKYRIVHSSMNTLSVFSLYAAKKAGVPVRVNHNHSTASKGETKKNLMKYALRPFSKTYATHLCSCSEYAGEWLYGKKTLKDGDVVIFDNAIDTSKYRFNAETREKVRNTLGFKNEFVIGHVGRFCFQKNQEFLLDTFAKYHDENKNSKLLLVGFGETMNDRKKQAENLGIKDDVIFLGARQDVSDLYQAMDCFAFPSRYEGLGLAVVEAQCAGLPVISSSAVPVEAKATNNIKFIEIANIDEWVAEIRKNKDRNRDREVQIDERYDIRKAAKKLEAFYDSVLEK